MIFLVKYDPRKGRLLDLQTFPEAARAEANLARLELELSLRLQAVDLEVVLLEAPDELSLRRTHRRYFESLSDLVSSSS